MFKTKNKLEFHKKACENKNFCGVVIPSEDTNILEFNQYQISDKTSFIIYADLQSLIKKINGCINNPKKISSTKKGKHISSRYSIFTMWTFDGLENQHDV